MTRTVTKIERIVYEFTREEVVNALFNGVRLAGNLVYPGSGHRVEFSDNGELRVTYDYAEPPAVSK